jgi:hypothetical protein
MVQFQARDRAGAIAEIDDQWIVRGAEYRELLHPPVHPAEAVRVRRSARDGTNGHPLILASRVLCNAEGALGEHLTRGVLGLRVLRCSSLRSCRP